LAVENEARDSDDRGKIASPEAVFENVDAVVSTNVVSLQEVIEVVAPDFSQEGANPGYVVSCVLLH
jgi:hypothetical protein